MSDQIHNARITEARVGFEDHGIFCASLMLDYGCSAQGFGPCLGDRAHEIIPAILRAVGADWWDQLKGRIVRVKRDEGYHGYVRAIGHPIDDKWADMRDWDKTDGRR